MQQDNYIKNKLQQLDNQQLPDLSQMDEHWKQMQAALQPVNTPPSKTFPKRGVWIIAGICLLAAIAFFASRQNSREKISPTAENKAAMKSIPVIDAADSSKAKTVIDPVIKKSDSSFKTVRSFTRGKYQLTLDNYQKIIRTDSLVFDSDSISTVEKLAELQHQQLLEALFNRLAKSPQEFVINNSKDTLLICKEGASLFIPAKSLGSGTVNISITEYFSKSDIVLNKLITTSNNEQLVSGGMVHIEAMQNGKPVSLSKIDPVKLFLPDTSAGMKQMQLFVGKEKEEAVGNMDTSNLAGSNAVNWIPQPNYFSGMQIRTQVWVLDLRNQPYKTIERQKGTIGVFNVIYKPKMPREEIRKTLKEKYGYYKVRFGFGQNSFFHGKIKSWKSKEDLTYSDEAVGDSVWMDKQLADRYKLAYTTSRVLQQNNLSVSGNPVLFQTMNSSLIESIDNRYNVNLSSLGWINCDRFYADQRQKVNYTVDIKQNANNYYTVLVFDRLKSVLNGNIRGTEVRFNNLPLGEPVTIISIGLKDGTPVVAMKKGIIGEHSLTGLEYQSVAETALKASLSKIDN